MPKTKTLNTNFSSGELSPKLEGRIDLEQYYKGARKAKNVIIAPQGGAYKRYGTELRAELPLYTGNFEPLCADFRQIPFVTSLGVEYMLVITQYGHILVYTKSAGLVSTITNSPYYGQAIHRLQYASKNNTLILTHPDYPVQQLTADSNGTFTIKDVEFDNIPTYSFSNTITNTTYPAVWRLYFNNVEEGDKCQIGFKQTSNGSLTPKTFTYSVGDAGIVGGGDSAGIMATEIYGKLVGFGYSVIPTYITKVKGGYSYRVLDYLIITKINNQVTGQLLELGTSNIKGGFMYLEGVFTSNTTATVDEDVWSLKRGYPATCVFHKGRLWFGGSRSRPQTVWGSRSFYEFDFSTVDPADIVDTDYIDRTINSNVTTAITSMYSSTRLILTTSDGSFTISSESGTPTPTDLTINQENSLGGKLKPMVRMDNTVFYLQEGGSELNSISYDYTSETYATYPNALFSNHLIKDPVDICVTTGTGDFNSESLYLVNDDGTASVYRRIQDQNVANWSEYTTQGDIIACGALYSEVWFISRRTNNDGIIYTLDNAPAESKYLDSYTTFEDMEGITFLSGLDVYAGNEVSMNLDGYHVIDTVSSTGTITLPFEVDNMTIGYPIEFELETMPVNVSTNEGNIKFEKKRINRSQVDIQDSYGFMISYLNRSKEVGDFTTDFIAEAPSAQTRVVDLRWLGWAKQDCTIVISDSRPYPVNIRSIELEIKY